MYSSSMMFLPNTSQGGSLQQITDNDQQLHSLIVSELVLILCVQVLDFYFLLLFNVLLLLK